MQIVPTISLLPRGPWVQFIIATPSGTFQWPPEELGWGTAKVRVTSASRKDNQKAGGRGKAKTKKSGPEPLKVSIELQFVRLHWEGPEGMCALLSAIDPNNSNGNGGPFDFQSADFNRRGGKSIDIDSIGPIDWRGNLGTCTIEAKEWVPEPEPAPAQSTTTPDKSAEYVPGDEADPLVADTSLVPLARTGIRAAFQNVEVQVQRDVRARIIAKRGFDGPENPTAAP